MSSKAKTSNLFDSSLLLTVLALIIAITFGFLVSRSLGLAGRGSAIHADSSPATGLSLNFDHPLGSDTAVVIRRVDSDQEVGRIDVGKGKNSAGIATPSGTYEVYVTPKSNDQAPIGPIIVSIQPGQRQTLSIVTSGSEDSQLLPGAR
jgi:hypothetical protein